MLHRAQSISNEPYSVSAPAYPIPIDSYHDHEKHFSLLNLLSFENGAKQETVNRKYLR